MIRNQNYLLEHALHFGVEAMSLGGNENGISCFLAGWIHSIMRSHCAINV